MSAKQKKYTKFTVFSLLPALLVAMAIAVPAFLISGEDAEALGTSDWTVVKNAVNAYIANQDGGGLEGEEGFRMTQAQLKSRIDSNGDGETGPTTKYLGEGDDAVNAPVLVDNLGGTTSGTANVIPGTSVRCYYNGAAATTSSCMNADRVNAVKARVDAHAAAGFSTDVVVYCATGRTEAPTTGGFGAIANTSGGLGTSTTPNVYGFAWGRNGWTNTSTFPNTTVDRTVGTVALPTTTYSVSSSAAPDCSAETTDAGRVRCAAAWALDSVQGNVSNGVSATTGASSFSTTDDGPLIDIRSGNPESTSTMISTSNVETPIAYDTVFNTGLPYIDVQTSTSKNVFVSRTSQLGGIVAMGARMLGYNATFLREGSSGWDKDYAGTWASTGVAYSTITATGSDVNSGVDQTAPTQSGINSPSQTSTSAVIERDASEPATMKVQYGTTPGGPYPNMVNNTVLNQTNKQVTLTGLSEYTTYYYVVTSYDGQANASTTSAQYSFTTLDVTPPATTDNAPAGWQTANFTVTLNCTDSGSGCASTWYRVDGVGSFVSGATVAINTDGDHLIEYYSKDVANNTESTKSVQAKLDKTKPVTTDNAPAGWQTADVTLNFTCSDATSGCASTEYSTDGGGSWTNGNSLLVSSEGVNQIAYRSTDAAGNTEDSKNVTVRIDKTQPVTTDNAPSGWQTSPVTVNFTCTDSVSGCAGTQYSLDNGANWTTGGSATFTVDGIYNIKYRSTDNAGNTEADPYATVQLDQTDPTTSASLSGTLGSNGWYTTNVTVTLTCSDATSGCNGTEYSTNGGQSWSSGNSLLVSAEGVNQITYRSTDAAGNTEDSKNVAVKIDKTAPAVSNVQPANGGTIFSGSTTLSADLSDTTSGIDNGALVIKLDNVPAGGCSFSDPTLSCPVSGLAYGAHSFTVEAKDNAGNQSTETINFTVGDNVAPAVNYLGPTGTINTSDTTVTATYSDAAPSSGVDTTSAEISLNGGTATSCTAGGGNISCSLTGLADGSYSAEVFISDNDGNTGSATGSFSINTSAPTVTPDPDVADYQPGNWTKDATPALLAFISDVPFDQDISSAGVLIDGGACDGTVSFSDTYVGCTPVTPLSEGPHDIDYWAEYSPGNPGHGLWNLNVDLTPPTTTDDAPAGWQTADVTVNLTCDDGSGSGCAVTSYRVNGGVWNDGNSVTITTQGNNNLDYRSNDNVDNSESPINNVIVQIDKTPPVTTDDAPSGWQTSPVTVNFTCTDSVSGCGSTEYSLDNGTTWTTGSSATFTVDGTYNIKYRSTDIAGNTEADPYATVMLDQTAPVTTGDAPSGWQNSDVTVNFSCSDATSGCDSTEYSLDGGSSWPNGNSVTITTEGTNTVMYRSYDNAGNTETAKSVDVKIDKTKPSTTDDAPAGWQNLPVTVNFTCSDQTELSGCSSTGYSLDNGTTWTTGSSATFTVDGIYNIKYRSIDNAGNTEADPYATVMLDLTAPVTTDDAPSGWQTGDITVTLTCSDGAGSGCATTKHRVDGGDWTSGNSVLVNTDGDHLIEYYSTDSAGNTEDIRTAHARRTSVFDVTGPIKARWDALNGAPGQARSPEYDVPGGRAQNFQNGRLVYNISKNGVFWIYGDILIKYDALGGETSFLGLPTTDEHGVPGGRATDFQGGIIYWSDATGAFEVHGDILGKYLSLGGPAGFLGFPLNNEKDAGVASGRMSEFQNGHIYWSLDTHAHEVHGAILARYLALGGPATDFLGLPLTDEMNVGGVPGARFSVFQGAYVYWSGATGAFEVHGDILGKYLSLGGPAGFLGFPLSDEYYWSQSAAYRSDFQGGYIWWTPLEGSQVS